MDRKTSPPLKAKLFPIRIGTYMAAPTQGPLDFPASGVLRMHDMHAYKNVLHFWFEETEPTQWWAKDETFDSLIRHRFSEVHGKAVLCELFIWREKKEGRLAEILVLDQFSRNMFRGKPQAFANDSLALALAQEAISQGVDRYLSPIRKGFLYLPFMHSESLEIHNVAEKLYSTQGLEGNLHWEIRHKNIIERFGRYPHRNEILGRPSTPEEIAFLKQPGSSF